MSFSKETLIDSTGTSLALIIRHAKIKSVSSNGVPDKGYTEVYDKKREIDDWHAGYLARRARIDEKLEKFEPLDHEEVQFAKNLHFCDFDCEQDEYFRNPTNLCADELSLYLEYKTEAAISYMFEVDAICQCWVIPWTYGNYSGDLSLSEVTFLLTGYEWLAKLPFYKFWSQLVFHDQTLAAVHSFLLNKNLELFTSDTERREYNALYRRMYHVIYDILFRLIQTEHSKSQKLSLATHMAFVRNHKMLTRAIILPICRLYGDIPLTRLLLQQIFSLHSDLKTNALASIGVQFRNVLPILSDLLTKLLELVYTKPENVYLGYLVILSYSEDLFAIRQLMSSYPPFIFIVQYLQLEKQVLLYVSNELFQAGRVLCSLRLYLSKVDHQLLWQKFCRITSEIVKIYRLLIEGIMKSLSTIDYKQNDSAFLKSKSYVKRYMNLYEHIFSYKCFALEYVLTYNVDQDNDYISEIFPELDTKERLTLEELSTTAKRLLSELDVSDSDRPHDNIDVLRLNAWDALLVSDEQTTNDLQKAINHQLKIESTDSSGVFSHVDKYVYETNKQYQQYLKKGVYSLPSDSDSSSSSALLGVGSDTVKHLRKYVKNPAEIVKRTSVMSHPVQEAINDIRTALHDTDSMSSDGGEGTASSTLPLSAPYNPERFNQQVELAYRKLQAFREGRELRENDVLINLTSAEVFEMDSASDEENDDDERNGDDTFVANIEETVTESLITEVQEVLPDLGEGFILECLKHYKNNAEDVMSAILEEKLPTQLARLNRRMPAIPKDPHETFARAKGHDRVNVFDGDEFDKMTKSTFDANRVFRKKNKVGHKSMMELLDDKADVMCLSARYAQYSVDLYEDDYDDSFDGYSPPVRDSGLGDEDTFTRPINAVNLDDIDYSSDEYDEVESVDKANRLNFCEDPAVLRQRAEERRAQKFLNKGGGGAHPPNKDVVGKAKGQDKEVLKNREKKNEKKSSRANHNRRSGAQWKRSRGMIPS